MLSKLRPSRRRAVSAAERGGKRLWRHFRGTLPGGLVEALAFCCPNWFWKKPNLDRSDYKSAPLGVHALLPRQLAVLAAEREVDAQTDHQPDHETHPGFERQRHHQNQAKTDRYHR